MSTGYYVELRNILNSRSENICNTPKDIIRVEQIGVDMDKGIMAGRSGAVKYILIPILMKVV